ncbi:MAG: type II toxin-antitoxin system VapC family toxin, partial [Microgenomates group bacterium]
MEKVVLDTSVVVKWFVEEKDSQKALNFLEEYRQGKLKLLAPQIVGLELANALFFGAGFKGKILEKALSAFYNLGITLVPLSEELVKESAVYSEKFKIAAYDALFIVVAEKEKCFLVTADKKHHQKSFSPRIKYL